MNYFYFLGSHFYKYLVLLSEIFLEKKKNKLADSRFSELNNNKLSEFFVLHVSDDYRFMVTIENNKLMIKSHREKNSLETSIRILRFNCFNSLSEAMSSRKQSSSQVPCNY